jgi:hypothetical protein
MAVNFFHLATFSLNDSEAELSRFPSGDYGETVPLAWRSFTSAVYSVAVIASRLTTSSFSF